MANTSTGSFSRVIGSFDSTGSSDAIVVNAARGVDVSISGTFAQTIDLERETSTGAANAENWVVIESYTAPVEKVVRNASRRRLRLTCSADTSGESFFDLTAGNRE